MKNLIYTNNVNGISPPLKRGLGGLKSRIHKNNPPSPLFKGGIPNSLFFLLIIFILFFGSCSNPYKNLTKTEYPVNDIQQIPYALPFSEKTLIYKTNISFYKNEISGLLIMKKMDDSIYRIALTTQFGLKIFDFELNNGTLNVKYCVEYLNKRVIINTFQNDFNLLLMQNQAKNIFIIENPEQSQKIWQLKSGKLNYNYIQNTDSEKIENISYKKHYSEKISVGLYNYKGNIPKNITLKHHNIKLKMNLKLIQ
jgi:hypothetical protein